MRDVNANHTGPRRPLIIAVDYCVATASGRWAGGGRRADLDRL